MTARAPVVTDTDVALLRSLARERSVVAASRAVGISRDTAVYRLARLERAFGGPVVAAERGGRGHGGTSLTPLGDRILRDGFDAVELLDARPVTPLAPSNHWVGVYRTGPPATVEVGPGLRLRVPFVADDGATVAVHLDPESVLVARDRFPSSARNVLAGTVVAVTDGPGSVTLVVDVGGARVRASVTEETVAQMRLRPGARVWLYVKATALRRGAPPGPTTRGSPRSRARTPLRPRAGSANR